MFFWRIIKDIYRELTLKDNLIIQVSFSHYFKHFRNYWNDHLVIRGSRTTCRIGAASYEIIIDQNN